MSRNLLSTKKENYKGIDMECTSLDKLDKLEENTISNSSMEELSEMIVAEMMKLVKDDLKVKTKKTS